jgi:uncharacterized Tic20 family protein
MSIADEIQKLDQLRQSGTISEDEFLDAKARVLNGKSSGVSDSVDRVLDSFGIGSGVDETERTWNYSMWLHLSLLCGFAAPGLGYVLPIVLWQTRKEDPIIDEHGKNAVNFLLSQLLWLVVGGVLTLVIIGFFIVLAVVIMSVVCPIMVGLKAKRGEIAKYPLTIEFI